MIVVAPYLYLVTRARTKNSKRNKYGYRRTRAFFVRFKRETVKFEQKNGARMRHVCSDGVFDHVTCSDCAVPWSKDLSRTAAMKHAVKYQLGVEFTAHTLYRAHHIISNEKEASYIKYIQRLHILKSLQN